MKHRLFRAALAACVAAAALSGCRLFHPGEARFSGSLEMTEHAVGMPAPGRLASIAVEEGQSVKKGQEIASLERYEQAKRDYERLGQLLKTGGARLQDYEHARLAMDEQRVVSPVDGIVLVKAREAGEVIAAGAPIATIGDTSSLWMRIYVPEKMIGRVRVGDPATVRLDGVSREYPARVSFVSPETQFTPRNVQTPEERVTQTFAVKVRLEEKAEGLRPGVFGDVVLRLNDR
jgi:HlyD family secretion protein